MGVGLVGERREGEEGWLKIVGGVKLLAFHELQRLAPSQACRSAPLALQRSPEQQRKQQKQHKAKI